mgnify:FL=1
MEAQSRQQEGALAGLYATVRPAHAAPQATSTCVVPVAVNLVTGASGSQLQRRVLG